MRLTQKISDYPIPLDELSFVMNLRLKNWGFTYTDIKWKSIKDLEDKELLKMVNTFRKQYVDRLLFDIVIKLENHNETIIEGSGSQNLTSDYDLTIYGPDIIYIITTFDEHFQNVFKTDSGTVFDTNLYGASFFFINHVCGNKKFYQCISKYNDNNGNKEIVNIINIKNNLDIVLQNIWAWISVIHSIPKNVNIDNFINFPDIIHLINFYKELLTQNNKEFYKLFIFEIKKYKDLSFKQNSSTIIKLKNSISHANFYADETYLTQGTFLHVVANMQMNYNIKLTYDEYVNSFIENFGKLIYEFNKSATISDYLYNIAKYMLRLIDAYSHFPFCDEIKSRELKKIFEIIQESKKQGDVKVSHKLTTFIWNSIFKSPMRRARGYSNLLSESINMREEKHKILDMYQKIYKDFIYEILLSIYTNYNPNKAYENLNAINSISIYDKFEEYGVSKEMLMPYFEKNIHIE